MTFVGKVKKVKITPFENVKLTAENCSLKKTIIQLLVADIKHNQLLNGLYDMGFFDNTITLRYNFLDKNI